jgi:hypothetical protein
MWYGPPLLKLVSLLESVQIFWNKNCSPCLVSYTEPEWYENSLVWLLKREKQLWKMASTRTWIVCDKNVKANSKFASRQNQICFLCVNEIDLVQIWKAFSEASMNRCSKVQRGCWNWKTHFITLLCLKAKMNFLLWTYQAFRLYNLLKNAMFHIDFFIKGDWAL